MQVEMNSDILPGCDKGLSLYYSSANRHKSCKLFFSTLKIVSTKKRQISKKNNDTGHGDSSRNTSQ